FELVAAEAEFLLEGSRLPDELVEGPHLAAAGVVVRVPEEEVGCEGNLGANGAAQDVAYGDAPFLSEDVEAGEFQSCEKLRAVVVERRGRIGDAESHLLEVRRAAAHQVGF